ncbi:hypothetical protein JD844_000324 [Phrynosoma platyrhinos]|uniref:Acyl-coenzyme A diphosphatase NUDT19 n=1 Tax=Phrynosoma platyrhinos TaxID=52577 RepID=A0ABQ7SQL8_PHRPL|nr:hypothetical protein JD844_000324 [Phrynosoma platyrhinos]
MNSRVRPWREAATVLLTAGGGGSGGHSPAAFDYRLLLLRRSPRSAFLPSAHVFPGGVADAADFSSEWLPLLPEPPRRGLRAAGSPKLPLFAAERPELGAALPGDVAFRLCAIRETFEEAGVLLLVPQGDAASAAAAAASPARLLGPERLPPASELAEWRRRVQRQPGTFLQLCRLLGCAPNLWALHEWSNWLTPWSTPLEAVELFKSQDIWIAPPQFYELCRLCNFSSLHDLHAFGSKRALEGCERDELYPEDPDFTGEKKPILTSDKKIEELMKGANKLHRIVTQNLDNVSVHVNIQQKYKHINPLITDSKVGNSADCNSRL